MGITKNQLEVRKMVFNKLDAISKQSKKLSEMFGKTGIGKVSFKELLDENRIISGKGQSKQLKVFAVNYNKTLHTMYQVGINFADKNNSEIIPYEFIESMVAEVKTAFTEGLKQR